MTRSTGKAAAEKSTDKDVEEPTATREESGDLVGGEEVARVEAPLPPEEVTEDGLISLRLAHPLSRKEDLIYLGLDVEKGTYQVNEEVRVTRNAALTLINAGQVQVDPSDPVAVREALGDPDPNAAPAG